MSAAALPRARAGYAVVVVAGAAFVIYAGAVASPYGLRVLTLAGSQVLLVLGYQFIFGHAGALSLAQGAFFGLGAYATAILGGHYGWGFFATFPLSILIPLTLAALVAAPVLRLASHYFALATLGLAQVVLLAVVNGPELTGGALGLPGIPGIAMFGATVPAGLPLLAAVWIIVLIGAALAARLIGGLTGAAYGVLRADPLAAGAFGLDGGRLRFAAFLLSAAYAGGAGALHAHTLRVVSSESLGFSVMVTCLAMTVIGGSTRIAGAFLGALLLVYLPEGLRFLEDYAAFAYGAALLAAIVLAPEGIAGLIAGWTARQERPAFSLPHPLPTAPRGSARSEIPPLEATGLTKRFGGIAAVHDIGLTLAPGEILGVIGPNGSGKTTLANLLTGIVPADHGTIRLGERRLDGVSAAAIARAGIARSFQNPALPPGLTALDAVAVARASAADALGAGSALRGADQGEARLRFEAEALSLLTRVGAEQTARELCGALPQERAGRVEIARALALDPAILILDEPAAGLGEAEQADLARRLRDLARSGIALLVIEHNMPFLLPIADRVLALDGGRLVASGTPTEIRRHPAVIAAYFGAAAGSFR
jgi:branched-chain amino acid transport system ATP-binding protein/branched-chain amino acid transport system permease protein